MTCAYTLPQQGWKVLVNDDTIHFHCAFHGGIKKDGSMGDCRGAHGDVGAVPSKVVSQRVPFSGGHWPEALGGFPFGPRREPSLAFLKELKEDGLPVWPEDEGPEMAANGASAASNGASPELFGPSGEVSSGEAPSVRAVERVAFAPGWLVDSWNSRGHMGSWDKELINSTKEGSNVPEQVIGGGGVVVEDVLR